jgi:hypothetical protein
MRHLIGSAPEIVLAHAKEPVLAEADNSALVSMMATSLIREKHAAMLAFHEAAAAQKGTESLREIMSKYPRRRLLDKPSFHFYYPYFLRLSRMNHGGAIIIHGLEEAEVTARLALLRDTLKPILKGGSTDAGLST